jgi:hypothetical protein
MYKVELYGRVRRAVLVEGRSQRALARMSAGARRKRLLKHHISPPTIRSINQAEDAELVQRFPKRPFRPRRTLTLGTPDRGELDVLPLLVGHSDSIQEPPAQGGLG